MIETLVVHVLHTSAGMVWTGATLFMALVGWPALSQRPAPEAQALLDRLDGRLGRLMPVAGSLTIVLGIVRGTLFGPVRSWSVLVDTPYGWTFALALLLAIALAVHGAKVGGALKHRLFDGDRWRPDAARILRRSAAFELTALALIVLCMGLMHFGR